MPSDPFDEAHETSREKSGKDRNDRYERQDKEITEISSQPERDRKGLNSREEKKEKSGTLDWRETPYNVEFKRREWYHHSPPKTPKQFEKVPKKDNISVIDDKDKQRSEKEKHEHSTRSEQNRERRRDGRERGVNSRSKGGSSFVNNTDQPAVLSGGSAHYESSRGRGSGNRSGAYERVPSNVQSGAAVSSGVGAYRDNTTLSREELETLIIEIGALGSRPFTYVFSDFQEPGPLTPAHLLLGRRVNSLPPARLTIDTNRKMEPILRFGI
ncbi:hypothetical protein HNY73_010019 [Argiope bruennichi]|uniref:Uncharacterized protein n=1 Tax=Argiope bruennichi TaxID=94029 RepID=A0A8T0F1W1_ARGBR|nr:hypothetical protein HNY73_010019 [Argiope bruennichi]